ncbi:MAG: DNA adenine methylase, partial [Bdellovibrio sp.]|nr:DNA adenine methylase [Bdellovibrio sp.]
MKPFLRWAGSKRQLFPLLRDYWPEESGRYIEPFAGSASLFFDLEPREAILGDMNNNLIQTYRMVKKDPYLVIESLKRLSVGRKAYYKIRDRFQEPLSEADHAAIFIYLNKFCFNGLYRTSKQGHFNVPFGDSKGNTKFDFALIIDASKLLANAQLISGDFQRTASYAGAGDFVYLDPPYWAERKRIFKEYQPSGFGLRDLTRLNETLIEF